jgi:hypothetical protein
VPPRANDVRGAGHRGRKAPEPLLPLVAPHLEVHVDDVVVRDREAGEAVADRERARLVRRVEPPDDADAPAEVADPERPGRPAGLQLRRRPGSERASPLEDDDVCDLLAVAVRDLAEPVREPEAAAERDRDRLRDGDGAVRPDVRADVCLDEVVRLGESRRRERERGDSRRRDR